MKNKIFCAIALVTCSLVPFGFSGEFDEYIANLSPLTSEVACRVICGGDVVLSVFDVSLGEADATIVLHSFEATSPKKLGQTSWKVDAGEAKAFFNNLCMNARLSSGPVPGGLGCSIEIKRGFQHLKYHVFGGKPRWADAYIHWLQSTEARHNGAKGMADFLMQKAIDESKAEPSEPTSQP